MKSLYRKNNLPALLLCLVCFSLHAQVNLSTINLPYTQTFDTMASVGATNDISTLPLGWTFLEIGANANTTYAASTGSSNTGNTFSFGLDASDRALGGLLSGSLTPNIGAAFINNTGTAINELNIVYRGEQWRLGTAARADRIDFQYSLNATSLTGGTWTDVDALDFSSPNITSAVGLLNGNEAQNSTRIEYTISGLNIVNGSTFFIRWLDVNASGADDCLAIDDFSLTPIGIPSGEPAVTFVPSQINFGDVQLNQSSIKSYVASASNLDTIITATVTHASLSLSLDSVTFTSSLTLPDSGAKVFVRFLPTTPVALNDTIIHISNATTGFVRVAGKGFNQADNIITISEARSKTTGTTVTVAGRITVASELGNPAYIQDATGGIPVFDYPLASSIEIGDSVIVTGPIGIFSNQKQISGNGIVFTLADTTKRIILPKPITINELAANEGLLVVVQHVNLVNNAFVFYPQSTEKITAAGVQADLRIDGDTNIPGLSKPKTTIDITGVVGRFNTSAQLLPRFKSDIPGASEPIMPSDNIPKDKTFDVATWNLEFFGAEKENYGNEEYGPEDENLQLRNVKKVISTLRPDIIGVEEISNDALFLTLVDSLSGYASLCSDRYSYSFNGTDNTFPPQKVCFIYDTTTVKILSSRVLFESLYDSARIINPSLLPGYPGGNASSFWSSGRLPFLVTIEANVNGAKEEVNLIVLHAKSGSTEADRLRRAYDAQVLKDTLDARFANNKVIVVGDYNDDLDTSITTGAQTPYAIFVNDTTNYLPITKKLSEAGARSTVGFNDMIDHIIVSNDLKDAYVAGSERVYTPFALIKNYSNTTSDHLAVATRFIFEPTITRFSNQSVTLREDSVGYTLTLSLSKPLSVSDTIAISLSGNAKYGQDFTTIPSALNNVIRVSIPAGETSASISILLNDDALDELAENAIFNIQSANGILLDNGEFTLTIADNDIPEVSFAELIATGEEGSGAHLIKLKLSTSPATDETVTIGVYNALGATGSDYVIDPSISHEKIHVVIPAGSTEGTFSLTALADEKTELKYELILFEIKSVSPGLKAKNPKAAAFAIVDVRTVPLKFYVSPNPTSGPVRITANQTLTEPVEVTLRNSNGVVLYTGALSLEAASYTINQKIQNAHRGLYMVQIKFDGQLSTFRLLRL